MKPIFQPLRDPKMTVYITEHGNKTTTRSI